MRRCHAPRSRTTFPVQEKSGPEKTALLLLCLTLFSLAALLTQCTSASAESRGAALHRVRVIDGYADREYAARGDVVAVRAAYPNSWWRFDIWASVEGGGISFANRTRPTTTFVMPDRAVTVRALFIRNDYDDTGIALGGCAFGGGALLPLLAATFCIVRKRKKRTTSRNTSTNF